MSAINVIPPKIPVITPIGSSFGKTSVLASISQRSINTLPDKNEIIRRVL